MRKISDLKATLEEMRRVYPFKDEETYIDLNTSPQRGDRGTIYLRTKSGNGTMVELTKEIEEKNEVDVR